MYGSLTRSVEMNRSTKFRDFVWFHSAPIFEIAITYNDQF